MSKWTKDVNKEEDYTQWVRDDGWILWLWEAPKDQPHFCGRAWNLHRNVAAKVACRFYQRLRPCEATALADAFIAADARRLEAQHGKG